ncbi:MAG: N-acetylmuramoyl-L-alanine amidase, partial [Bacteroidota bacterium]
MRNGFKKAIYNIYKTFWLLSIFIFYGCDQPLHSQKDYSKEKKRLDYLCLGNGLKNLISIDQEGVKIYSSDGKKENKPEFTLYWDETKYFIELTKNVSIDSMEKIYFNKGNSKFDKIIGYDLSSITLSKGLKGKKIAIDPGHFAGDLSTAKIEQKFLDFKYKFDQGDSTHIQIAEGILTWQTAYLLKKTLEEQGAEVVLTREEINSTSFGKSYEAWFKDDKIKILDSLRNTGKLKEKEYKKLISLSKSKFFWEFFRDFELANRVKVMNKFKPDLSVIIHYNVDEKNTDWKKPTVKNFTMAFIGGGMTSDNFEKTSHKINFLRLLLSEDLD